jgi:hypothetical protein
MYYYCYPNLYNLCGMKQKIPSLLFCIVMDIIGYATYAIPFLGEYGDILWAPISGWLFYQHFGTWRGAVGGVLNMIEEALPFTDFIPSFTIMYFLQQKNAVVKK